MKKPRRTPAGTPLGAHQSIAGGFPKAVERAVGERRVRELALTGRIFTTPEALQWGLVHAAAPAFELGDRVFAVAQGVAAADPETMRRILQRS